MKNKTITKLNVSKQCPRFGSCNSAFCPASMEGIHQPNEAICKYFRLISRNETGTIPQVIIDAITNNEKVFLEKEYRGYMSQYRYIKNMGSAL
jgi:hypothetical protein